MNTLLHFVLSLNWNLVIVIALFIVLGIVLSGSPTYRRKGDYWHDEKIRKNNRKNRGKKK